MTPNFAFLLSQDTLRLLMQVEAGWAEVGHVSTSAPDMAERLGEMRDKALAKAPLGMITKLVVPNDYIRYLSLPPGQSRDQVLVALEGATPYAVSELVIDFETDAASTQVAAVAREFLDEAEKFATDHGMPPVSFVANPREGSFEREIFFGATKGATRLAPRGAALGPEDSPMVIVPMPEGAVARAAEPEKATKPAFRVRPQEGTPPATPTKAPTNSGNTGAGAASGPSTNPALRAITARSASQRPTSAPNQRIAAAQARTREAPNQDPAAALRGQAQNLSRSLAKSSPNAGGQAPKPISFASRSKPSARKPPAPTPPKLPTLGSAQDPVFKRRAREAAKVALAKPVPAKVAPAPPEPSIWQRGQAALGAISRKSWGLGAAACAGLSILALGLYAIVPSAEQPDVIAMAPPNAAEPATDVSAGQIQTGLMPPSVQTGQQSGEASFVSLTELPQRSETSAAAAQPQLLSIYDAQRLYAATGVWQKAPGAPAALRSRALALQTPSPSSAPAQLRSTPQIASAAALAPLPRPLELPSPPGPDARFVMDSRGLVVPSAEGTRSPRGVLVFAGRPSTPPPARPGLPQEAPDVANAPASVAQARPSVLPPARPTQTLTVSAVETIDPAAAAAAPAVEIGPEGIRIRNGSPSVVPPPRPRRTGAIAPVSSPDGVTPPENAPQQALLRPRIRPSAGVALTALTQQSSGLLRPRARPADFEPTAEEIAAAQEPDDVSPYAVARAIRPSRRPGNIATIVAAAQNVAASAPRRSAAPQAVAAAARPSGPTATTVAARATQENVIRLNRINLIGVYGTQRNRRALVRLSNGRFQRVAVGERLDGGRVTAIGTSQLQYTKNGQRVTLEIPS